jgi:ankyrin repeat protein
VGHAGRPPRHPRRRRRARGARAAAAAGARADATVEAGQLVEKVTTSPSSMADAAEEAVPPTTVEPETVAATKIQAIQRGKIDRKAASHIKFKLELEKREAAARAAAEASGEAGEVAAAGDLEPPVSKEAAEESLFHAAMVGDAEKAKRVLGQSPAAALAVRDGRTALGFAAQEGHGSIVTALRKAGADISHRDPNGFTPLHSACQRSRDSTAHLPIVQELLDAGAEINAKTEYNFSPLFFAVAGHDALVELLLKRGANAKGRNGADDEGTDDTLLHTAAVNGRAAAATMLLSAGVDAMATGFLGEIALAVVKNASTARVLIEAGSDTAAKDERGRTVLDRLGAEGSEWFSAEAAGAVRAAIAAGNQCCLECHPLTRFETSVAGYECDLCSATQAKGVVMWGCRVCDWDACDKCRGGGPGA